jgi:hypothetical protein
MANKQTRPFMPTLNDIRSAEKAPGYAVAEALDSISESIAQTNATVAGLKSGVTSVTTTVQQVQSQVQQNSKSLPSTPTNVPFAIVSDGTNTQADMVVGDGASLSASGAGTINATEINGVGITGTPKVGDVPVATSGNTAIWVPLGMITSIDCMNTTSIRGGIDCGSLS